MDHRRTPPKELAFRRLEAELAKCEDAERQRQLLRQIRRTGLWSRAYETWHEYLEKRWDMYE